MNTLGKCPIRIAIDDIRVGGRGNDDPETSTAPTMRIRGAGADDLTYVIDDVQYFLNARSIAIARAKFRKRQYGMESQLDLTLPSLPPNMEAASAASTAMTPDTMIAIANAAIDVLNRTDATALGI